MEVGMSSESPVETKTKSKAKTARKPKESALKQSIFLLNCFQFQLLLLIFTLWNLEFVSLFLFCRISS